MTDHERAKLQFTNGLSFNAAAAVDPVEEDSVPVPLRDKRREEGHAWDKCRPREGTMPTP